MKELAQAANVMNDNPLHAQPVSNCHMLRICINEDRMPGADGETTQGQTIEERIGKIQMLL